MVIHASNPSWGVQNQPGLHSKLKANLCYLARPCLKKINYSNISLKKSLFFLSDLIYTIK
jgi:hypothetical protein